MCNFFKWITQLQERWIVLDRLDLGLYTFLTDQMILNIILLRF